MMCEMRTRIADFPRVFVMMCTSHCGALSPARIFFGMVCGDGRDHSTKVVNRETASSRAAPGDSYLVDVLVQLLVVMRPHFQEVLVVVEMLRPRPSVPEPACHPTRRSPGVQSRVPTTLNTRHARALATHHVALG